MKQATKKFITFLELNLIVLSVISFSYLVGESSQNNLFETTQKSETLFSNFLDYLKKPIFSLASANPFYPAGCCLETKSGAICQDMNILDSGNCKSPLIGTSCSLVQQCQTGCCYDSSSGICTLNAPKEKCELNGGTWKNDASCNVAECQVGCCALGNSVAMTTTKECSVLSKQFNFEVNFLNLDSQGSCDAYQGLTQEGACLTPSTDFSEEKNCVFTTKDKCSGEFKSGYLCTSKELNTNCEKTQKTSCFADKDEIYFLDSCNNRANIYDSSKYNNDNYWEKIISPENSCPAGSQNCGTCDYASGSVCKQYDSRKDQKPLYGNFVCRNLDCSNGKKHGESWCVSDYDVSKDASAPVGSGNYVAKCIENEIKIESCADFNQEICIQNQGSQYSEAKCTVNDWRSCLSANEKESYEEVERECSQYPQCVMFLDITGNEKYKGLPGFKDSGLNIDQGKAGKVGQDSNKVLAHCVPKFTPGMQFWSTPSNLFSQENSKEKQESFGDYGGSKEETNSICSLGSFTCVSHIETDTSILGGSSSKDKENPECNIDAINQDDQQVELLMQALNERCRSLGSCGAQLNVQGQMSYDEGFTLGRIYIDKKGKMKTNISLEGYNLSTEYLSSLKAKQPSKAIGSFKKMTDLTSVSNAGHVIGFLFASLFTGRVTQQFQQTTAEAQSAVSQNAGDYQADQQLIMGAAGGIGALAGLGLQGAGSATTISAGTVLTSGTYTSGTITVPIFTTVGESSLAVTAGQNTPVVISESGIVSGGNLAAGQTLQSSLGEGGLQASSPVTQAPTTTSSNLRNFGTQLAVTAIAMVAAYYVGKIIAKNSGMTPAETNNFMSAMMSGASVIASTYFVIAKGLTLLGGIGLAIAIIYFISSLLQTSTDHEYYIFEFRCEAWAPPRTGDCNACNDDVRPCTEYKCRSIGQNCQYFTDNGEPGFCSSISGIWQAKITPWYEIISGENKYSSVTEKGFFIESKTKKEVEPYTPLTFGIETDKPAICKLGFDPSLSFDEMTFTMQSDIDIDTNRVSGMNYKVTLSPHVTYKDIEDSQQSSTTIPIETGENEYYIKCRNFAGQVNEAAFVVKVWMAEGPDLTPASVTRYLPPQNSFIKQGANSSALTVFLNEPAECRYSSTYDYTNYDEMPNQMVCQTEPSQGYYGEWACYTLLENLTEQTNKLFIKCKDQPNLEETDLVKRIVNSNSYQYTLNICQVGLNLDIVSPKNEEIIVGKNATDFELIARTTGCIDNGRAICSYKINSFGNVSVDFLETNSTLHRQRFNTLTTGDYELEINCIDEALNNVSKKLNFSIFLDQEPPVITRIFQENNVLILKTNEPAECLFNYNNPEIGCAFDFQNASNSYSTEHRLDNANSGTYYIKCKDNQLNEPATCSAIVNVLSK